MSERDSSMQAGAEARRMFTHQQAATHSEAIGRYLGARLRHELVTAGPGEERQQTGPSAPPIVVGVDGSVFSREALRWAVREAALRGCAVRAVLAVPGGVSTSPEGLITADRDRGLVADTVQAVVPAGDRSMVEIRVVAGTPAEILTAASAKAQLLVVGSRGRGAVTETVLGSVTRYCVRHSRCPVVVLPAPREGEPD